MYVTFLIYFLHLNLISFLRFSLQTFQCRVNSDQIFLSQFMVLYLSFTLNSKGRKRVRVRERSDLSFSYDVFLSILGQGTSSLWHLQRCAGSLSWFEVLCFILVSATRSPQPHPRSFLLHCLLLYLSQEDTPIFRFLYWALGP